IGTERRLVVMLVFSFSRGPSPWCWVGHWVILWCPENTCPPEIRLGMSFLVVPLQLNSKNWGSSASWSCFSMSPLMKSLRHSQYSDREVWYSSEPHLLRNNFLMVRRCVRRSRGSRWCPVPFLGGIASLASSRSAERSSAF